MPPHDLDIDPCPTPDSTVPHSVRYDSKLTSRKPSPSPSLDSNGDFGDLNEKSSGPECQTGGSDDAQVGKSENSHRPHVAGHRFTVAHYLGLGRWQRSLTVFGCFMLMFNSWGLVNAYGTYQSYYKQHLLPGHSMALLNLVGSTQSSFVLLFSIVVGRFLDAGHFYRLTCTGAVLVTLGSFLLSLEAVTDYFVFVWLTQGMVMSLGMACMFVPSSQIVASWFTKWKTVFMGVVASGASIAGLIYPLALKHLIPIVGFHRAQRYVAIVTAVTCLLAAVFSIPNPDRVVRPPKTWTNVRTFLDTDIFRNKASLGLIFGIGLLFTGFYAVFFNLEDWAADTGLGHRDEVPNALEVSLVHEVPAEAIRTFWLLSIMNACSTFGRIGFTLMGDFFGALRTHAAVTLVASLLLLTVWTTATSLPHGIAFVVLYGVVSGADIALPPGSMADILGDDPVQRAKLGQWVGLMYMCASPLALVGPVLGGLLIGVNGAAYLPLQLWCGIALFLSACAMVWASLTRVPVQDVLSRWSSWSREMV